jgi:hypothetical protein
MFTLVEERSTLSRDLHLPGPILATLSLSARFELPFFIIAFDHAMKTHHRFFGSHSNVSKHTTFVTGFARDYLPSLSCKWPAPRPTTPFIQYLSWAPT